jgi:6-phosphogluconolactonase
MTQPHVHRFPDATALTHALATEVQVELQEAIAARGRASLVVSGGRTPVQLFNQLAQEQLDWSKVSVTLADERWVDAHEVSSNERLVRTELLRGHAAQAHFVGLKNAATTPVEGAQWAWRSLSRITRPFDVVLLGMGDDGHTASLFPQSPGLTDALNSSLPPACVAMHAPVAPHDRLSLNLSALLDARRVFLHIQGAAKLEVYHSALAHGPVSQLPIRAFIHQQMIPFEVFWSP